MDHWLTDNWASNPEEFYIFNSTYARSNNVALYYDPETKTYTQSFGVQTYVQDDEGKPVPYVFNNRYQSEGFVSVQSGLIGAEFHKGKVVYYDPSMLDLAVGRENFVVYKWNEVEGKWLPICANIVEYFNSVDFQLGENHINITGVWSTGAGTLTILYHFYEDLKHTITFEPTNPGKYAVVQVWNEVQYSDVKLSNSVIIKRTDDVVIGKSESLQVLFFSETQPFGILTDQKRGFYNAEGVEVNPNRFQYAIFAGGTVNYQGYELTDAVGWVFGGWNLQEGEALTIDPTTSTTLYPTDDSYTWEWEPAVNQDGDGWMRVCSNVGFVEYAHLKFDLTSIPGGSNVTDANLGLNYFDDGSMHGGGDPVGNVHNVSRHTADSWDETTITWNNKPAHDPTALDTAVIPAAYGWVNWTVTSDVQLNVSGLQNNYGWVIVDQSVANEQAYYHDRETAGVATDPQLMVTYRLPEIGEFKASTPVYAYQYFRLNTTINSVAPLSFQNVSITMISGSDDVSLLWVNSTDVFSELADSGNWYELNGSASFSTSVNASATELTWNGFLGWNFTEGAVNVNATFHNNLGTSVTGNYTALFTFEDDLDVNCSAAIPPSVNTSGLIAFNGTLFYNATATPPYNDTGLTVYAELSGVNQGSTPTVNTSDGFFNITGVIAPHTAGNYSYNIYSYTDEPSTANITVYVLVSGPTGIPPSIQAQSAGLSGWLNQILAGDFFGGLLAPYIGLFGNLFWGLLFVVINMALYLRTRSIGFVLFFTAIGASALVGVGVFPPELSRWVIGILVVTIAALIYWIFAGRER